jgi:large repetitive protein
VQASDEAENVDTTPATHNWTITQGCAGSTVTLGAAADSWILQDSANQNYGTDSVLKVDTKSNANARAVVRFALPAIPAGCQVTNARLRLYASSYKDGRTLQALRLLTSWTESALTWNNQPQTTGTAATVASGSGYREWTVTSQVQAMYAPGAKPRVPGARRDRERRRPRSGLQQPREGLGQPAAARADVRSVAGSRSRVWLGPRG